ncbi:MAG: hypothetical protein GY700_13485 [Propionibacteriaceae bacterium]|nr:hypothetical protein [Propionibacteriaceae bacterium]
MNATVQAAITASLAALETTSSVPAAPYYYGSDISCESDVDQRWSEVSDSALVLAQHCVRALDTPQGLPDDGSWGLSITEYCNRTTTRAELYGLEGRISAELRKDDRIDDVRVAVESSTDCTTLTVSIRVVPVDPMTEDFSLTLSVSDAGILIEEMSR